MDERERLSWAEFGEATRDLARQVADDGYAPDLVLSVARGGLLVGAALGYALDVKNSWAMNVEFYTGVDERLDVPMILPPVPELVDLRGALLRARHYHRRTCDLSLADCVLLASAGSGDSIATADPAIAAVARAEGIGLLPLPDSSGQRP